MSAKHDTKPPTQFHSDQELRDEIAKLNRQLDEVERIMDAKIARSIYRVRADVPKREEKE